jgi:hypothetical protein
MRWRIDSARCGGRGDSVSDFILGWSNGRLACLMLASCRDRGRVAPAVALRCANDGRSCIVGTRLQSRFRPRRPIPRLHERGSDELVLSATRKPEPEHGQPSSPPQDQFYRRRCSIIPAIRCTSTLTGAPGTPTASIRQSLSSRRAFQIYRPSIVWPSTPPQHSKLPIASLLTNRQDANRQIWGGAKPELRESHLSA